jgi:hypothetical protein
MTKNSVIYLKNQEFSLIKQGKFLINIEKNMMTN